LIEFQKQGDFKAFPFGSDNTPEEIVLGGALRSLKNYAANNKLKMIPVLLRTIPDIKIQKALPFLKRMALESPKTKSEHTNQKLVVFALELVKAI
jgi:hypothetical protein